MLRTATLTFIMLAYASGAHATQNLACYNSCDTFAREGLRSFFTANNQAETNADLDKWFCSDEEFKKTLAQRGEIGISVPISGVLVPFSASNSTNEAMESRKKYCESQKSSFNQWQRAAIFSNLVSPSGQEAWLACIRSCSSSAPHNGGELSGSLTPDMERVEAEVVWNGGVAIGDSLAFFGLDAQGMTCRSDDFAKLGNPIRVVKSSCTWNTGAANARLLLFTSRGPWSAGACRHLNPQAGSISMTESRAVQEWVDSGKRCEQSSWTHNNHNRKYGKYGGTPGCHHNADKWCRDIVHTGIEVPAGMRIVGGIEHKIIGGPGTHFEIVCTHNSEQRASCELRGHTHSQKMEMCVNTQTLTHQTRSSTTERALMWKKELAFSVDAAADAVVRASFGGHEVVFAAQAPPHPLVLTSSSVGGGMRHLNYRLNSACATP